MEHNHFTVIVAGDNPQEIMSKYNANNKVTPYLIYKFSDAGKYKKQFAEMYEKSIASDDVPESIKNEFQLRLEELNAMDDISFYMDLTRDLQIDQNSGDAYSDENVDGKYIACNVGKNWSLPLIDKNGEETYSCKKGDIDFSKIHMANTEPYKVAWETVMEGREPKNEEEKRIYENMKNRKSYFENFGDKDKYIAWSTSFWGSAFVDKDHWFEITGNTIDDQIKWVTSFYDTFIKKLSKNTLITIYECLR